MEHSQTIEGRNVPASRYVDTDELAFFDSSSSIDNSEAGTFGDAEEYEEQVTNLKMGSKGVLQGSTTRYDPASMARVDVESHVHELEAQILPMEERHQAGFRKMFLKGFAACVVVGLVVGVAVGVSGGDSSSNSETDTQSITLAAPHPDLANICSESFLSTVEGYKLCEEECEAADCCKAALEDDLSCLVGNEEVCMLYNAACENLEEGAAASDEQATAETISIPLAPDGLKESCTIDAIKTIDGFMKCEESCLPAECCYTRRALDGSGIANCYFSHDECKEYGPCMILTDPGADVELSIDDTESSTEQVTVADTGVTEGNTEETKTGEKDKAIIDEACTTDHVSSADGHAACVAVCAYGTCCVDPAGADECDVDCETYHSCAILYNKPPPPSEVNVETTEKVIVDEACSSDLFAADETACRALCNAGQCCFGDGGTCDLDCGVYESCSILFDEAGGDTQSLAIEEACSESVELAVCEELCAPGACCYARDASDTCNVDCAEYSSCHILHENDGFSAESTNVDTFEKDAIDAACTDDAFANGNILQCEALCVAGSCCFTDDVECLSGVHCDIYDSCSQIYANDPTGDVDFFDLQVDEICAADMIVTTQGFNACLDTCKDYLCCFAPEGHPNSCTDNNQDCKDYAPCQGLMQPNQVIADFCSSENVAEPEGFGKCKSICDGGGRGCCWVQGDDNCWDGSETWCMEYSPCQTVLPLL